MDNSSPMTSCTGGGDRCCVWMPLVAEMFNTFTTRSGRCSALARAAVRLGFHDAVRNMSPIQWPSRLTDLTREPGERAWSMAAQMAGFF